jgi:nitrogen fixation NifU-like protein
VADLGELYQQLIIEHNRAPRNVGRLTDANRTAEGDNPLCGDRISLYLKVRDGVIEDVAFQGRGCAISQASASLMTGAVKGRTVADAQTLYHTFHDMVAGGPHAPADPASLGKLAAFAGVRAFPARVKCANLSWHTLRAALEQQHEPVTTE